MNWVAGRLKAGSNLRILKRGNIISDQCPMAVCRAARFANFETLIHNNTKSNVFTVPALKLSICV